MSDPENQEINATQRSTPRSSGSSISPSTSSTTSSTGSAKSAVSECLGAWLSYLQLLNNLVASGYRLTQCISTLEGWTNAESQATPASATAYQILSAWDELAKATSIATSTVKSHIVSKLQDFITQPVATFENENELQRAREHNQYVVHDSFQTLTNLQHQFSVASCEFFVQCIFQSGYPVEPTNAVSCTTQGLTLTDMRSQTPSPAGLLKADHLVKACERFGSGSTHASSDHQFEQIRGPSPIQGMGHLDHIRGPLPNPGHLLTMKTPFYRGSRSPLNFPLFPSNGQRRWSETAAVQSAAAQEDENQARRWSMPWEHKTDKQSSRMPISKLAVPMHQTGPPPPAKTSGDRSHSITSESSVDGLTEAIQLLSCKPVQRTLPMQHSIGAPFIEEPGGMYGIWSTPQTQVSPHLRFMREQEKSFDENAPP
ncbi:uncharacterized protein LOC134836989 [Culicoides brevitarsis]|uniref:uncharacterized protein LOC134836989 n=1 Tax=Culicoides brevitarsis TaxID=469753 RepID=UPI00307C0C6F